MESSSLYIPNKCWFTYLIWPLIVDISFIENLLPSWLVTPSLRTNLLPASGLLLSINIEDIQIIYPNTCKELVDNKYVNLILKEEIKEYQESVTFDKKPSLWQRFKNSKFIRAIRYITKVRIVLDVPALPSGDEERR